MATTLFFDRRIRIGAVFLAAFLCFPFLAKAEAFRFELSLPLNAPTLVFRDETIEKYLEILYLGIYDTPDPNDKTKVFSSYKYQLLMKNYLGAVVGEKFITIPKTSLKERNIDFLVYDPNLTRWVSFEDIELIVLPSTTGTFSNIVINGRGTTILPKVEPFGTGAYRLGNTLHLKVLGEYLPPDTSVTLTASVNKKDRYGAITVIGDFPQSVKTDASGKGIYEKDVTVKELFDDISEETYFLSAAAVYLYKFKEQSVIEKSAEANEVKQIYLGDFDLFSLFSEFLNNRAYITFNDNLTQVVSSRLLFLEDRKSNIDVFYNKSIKTYVDASQLNISLSSFNGKNYIYEINSGVDSFGASVEVLGRLEITSSNPLRRASFNGVEEEFDADAYSFKFILSGSNLPRVIFYDKSGKVLHETSARDISVNFRSEKKIDHKYFLDTKSVTLQFEALPTDGLVRWDASLKSEKKRDLVKSLTISGKIKYNPELKEVVILPVAQDSIIVLQRRLIELLNLLLRLLNLQSMMGR